MIDEEKTTNNTPSVPEPQQEPKQQPPQPEPQQEPKQQPLQPPEPLHENVIPGSGETIQKSYKEERMQRPDPWPDPPTEDPEEKRK